jgi:hydrogenase maturation protease
MRVIGVGNVWRGDDAVGILAARRLRKRWGASVEILEADGDGLALLDLMEDVDHVILIDALKSGRRPGETVRLDVSAEHRWGSIIPCSTHAIGIAEAIDLARALGHSPKQIILYGVEIASLESGATLCDAVCEGLNVVVELVNQEVERARCMKCI